MTTLVIGGGLAGMSAAMTVLENGGRVVVLEKTPFCGGNSVKATSGINGAGTRTQLDGEVYDSPKTFYEDTLKGARDRARPELIKVLTYESGAAVSWLQDAFGLDLSILGRLGGHSFPRTHRGTERFPGMTITQALIEAFEDACEATPERARLITKARVTSLIKENGEVVGVTYEAGGKTFEERGAVILATGGYGSDFSDNSLLAQHRPELIKANLSTTNGDHCTGDGIKLAVAAGADTADMDMVQVHPTGLVDPKDPECKLRFLAAEALRGTGALLIDSQGRRFCNELGHRDYVTGEMNKGQGPFYLVLNSKCAKEIEWHCKHYTGRGLMAFYKSGAELARKIGVSANRLSETFRTYNANATPEKDPFGKKFFSNTPWDVQDTFYAAVVTPVIHYTMGGLAVNAKAEVLTSGGAPLPGLFATGEVMGGVHGVNRLGGSSLLDCVVFGRVSGRSAARHQFIKLSNGTAAGAAGSAAPFSVTVDPANNKLEISWGKASGVPATSAATATPAATAAAPEPAAKPTAEYTLEEVAKHNTVDDLWVIVGDRVLDVSEFRKSHPGGSKALELFAGRDATEEYNMLHKKGTIDKYAKETVIGKVAGGPKSKL